MSILNETTDASRSRPPGGASVGAPVTLQIQTSPDPCPPRIQSGAGSGHRPRREAPPSRDVVGHLLGEKVGEATQWVCCSTSTRPP
eukprot:COSAG04_NODE_664_length_11441_cov_5.400458_6_plen_86_part_00